MAAEGSARSTRTQFSPSTFRKGTIDPSELVPWSEFTPMQRVVLNANGTLHHLMSSYYNEPVATHVNHQRLVTSECQETHYRQVTWSIFGQEFAVAYSTICCTSSELNVALHAGMLVGEVFRKFALLPNFNLLKITKDATDVVFSREYTLCAPGLDCKVYQELQCNMFELSASAKGNDTKGNSMETDFKTLHGDFTPLQRLLLTAEPALGTPQRIIGSFYDSPVVLHLVLNHNRMAPVYDRQVAMLVDGRQLMSAKSTIFVTDAAVHRQLQNSELELGVIFGNLDFHFVRLFEV